MFTATIYNRDNVPETVEVFDPEDAELPLLEIEPRGSGWKKGTPDYLNAICCLDTETSKLIHTDPESGIELVDGVWIYQWCLNIDGTLIAGRTAEDLIELMRLIYVNYGLSRTRRLVIWIHNAAYDLSYLLNGLYAEFDGKIKIFATGQRRPIRCSLGEGGGLEIRCSWKLVNKSLAAWCNDVNPMHPKRTGEINYNVMRLPTDELTAEDWDYMICDVISQRECLEYELSNERLRTVPMTSTGFVRRAMRKAARKNPGYISKFREQLPTAKQYMLMRKAFTGGYTHANSLALGIWHDVYSFRCGFDVSRLHDGRVVPCWCLDMDPDLEKGGSGLAHQYGQSSYNDSGI